jgi:hypothetical protein
MDTSLEIKWKCLVLRDTSSHLDNRNLLELINRSIRGLHTAFYEDGAMTHRTREVDDERSMNC